MERFLYRERWQPHISKAIGEIAARAIRARVNGKPVDLTFHECMIEMIFAHALRGKLRKAMEIGAFLKFLPLPDPKEEINFNWDEEREKLFQRLNEMGYAVEEE